MRNQDDLQRSLERRLRLLAEVPPGGPLMGHDLERYQFAEAAAKIGADIEREACARDMQHHPSIDGNTADRLADCLRRGGDR